MLLHLLDKGWVVVLLLLILTALLMVYPIIHFLKSAPARLLGLAATAVIISLFGYHVWLKRRISSFDAPSQPGVVLKHDSDQNNISRNQLPATGQILLDHSKGNNVTNNVWVPYSPALQGPNKFDAMTNAQLENAVSKITKNLRDFDKRIAREQDDFDEPNPDRVAAWQNANDVQRKKMQYERMKKQSELGENDNRYFQDNFLNDCRFVNVVLDKRVIAKPSSSIRFAMVSVTLDSGMLGGPYPLRNLADYLDSRAEQLRAQSKER